MQRLYLPNTQFSEKITIAEKETIHQLIKVLRLGTGDSVIFFDGIELVDYVYEIATIEKKQIQFQKKEALQKKSELSFSLTLYQAIPNKLSKLEYIVQKCSEVGYAKIVFFSSERSQKFSLTSNKIQRLESIVKEAIEQCGRNILPKLVFEEHITDTADTKMVFHPGADKKISDISLKTDDTISLYIGPEGGFSKDEIDNFHQKGVQSISLGNSILRCETTGVVTGFYLGQMKRSSSL